MAEKDGNNKKITLDKAFSLEDAIPDAYGSLSFFGLPISEAIRTADVFLDTNTLLLPYGAGANSLDQIVTALKKLKNENRLFLPAQAAREFIKNRPNKLSELQQGLADKISRFNSIDISNFPVLENIEEYKELNRVSNEISNLKKTITKTNRSLLEKIKSWEWNDPVNSSYEDLFSKENIVSPSRSKQELFDEHLRRQNLQQPPGYKDSNKPDSGIGDFLIWTSIIEVGSKNKNHAIFVSGEEKADWQHRSGSNGFLPRYELVDEYRRASDGKTFFIAPLSKLLELLDAEASSIEEIKKEENRIAEANTAHINCPTCFTEIFVNLGSHIGDTSHPLCSSCNERLHLHRTRRGVLVNGTYASNSLPTEIDVSRKIETTTCPNCESPVVVELGNYRNSTAWCNCEVCEARFALHRREDGSTFTGKIRQAKQDSV